MVNSVYTNLPSTKYKLIKNPIKKQNVPYKPKKCIGLLLNLLTKVMVAKSKKPSIMDGYSKRDNTNYSHGYMASNGYSGVDITSLNPGTYNLFVKLEKDGYGNKIILGYDQNRAGLQEWVDEMYRDDKSSNYFDGTAIHWYESTYDFFPEALQYAHNKAPNKYLIETEGCVDSEIPKWQDDDWYWSKEATDWGWDWASEKDKHLHPKYAPVNRYVRDIIGCLNNWVDGWVDWNMVLDTQGGPNWFKNWCVAPIIVDPEKDEVYFTPIYYTMAHFSKYIRPQAEIIEVKKSDKDLMVTAAKNTDGSIAVVIFNEGTTQKSFQLSLGEEVTTISINAQAIQTILINTI